MKVLLFTSQDISLRLAEHFARKPGVELAVVTQVTQRDRIYGYRSAVEFCGKEGIPCWRPRRLDEAFVEQARAFAPDIIVAAYYPKIFPKPLIDLPRLGAFNVHPGDLPHYRGTFAIPWTILNGEKEFAVTLHRIDEGVDSGDIVVKKRHAVGPDETGFGLYVRAMHLCADLVIESFDGLAAGTLGRTPQTGEGSYYDRLEPRCHIDWNQPRETIKRLVRVHAKPYLPAFTHIVNRCIYVNRVSFQDLPSGDAPRPGTVTQVLPDGRFAVACGDGALLVEEYEAYPPLDAAQSALHFTIGARLG